MELTAYLYPSSLIKQNPWLSALPIAQLIQSSACSSYQLLDGIFFKSSILRVLFAAVLVGINTVWRAWLKIWCNLFQQTGIIFFTSVTLSVVFLSFTSQCWILFLIQGYDEFNLFCTIKLQGSKLFTVILSKTMNIYYTIIIMWLCPSSGAVLFLSMQKRTWSRNDKQSND